VSIDLKKIALLAGDGIGPEIITPARELLELVGKRSGVRFEFREGLIGGSAIDSTGSPFPEATKELVRKNGLKECYIRPLLFYRHI